MYINNHVDINIFIYKKMYLLLYRNISFSYDLNMVIFKAVHKHLNDTHHLLKITLFWIKQDRSDLFLIYILIYIIN
jgi:hypothetical protein